MTPEVQLELAKAGGALAVAAFALFGWWIRKRGPSRIRRLEMSHDRLQRAFLVSVNRDRILCDWMRRVIRAVERGDVDSLRRLAIDELDPYREALWRREGSPKRPRGRERIENLLARDVIILDPGTEG